jgi:hypothetical protein
VEENGPALPVRRGEKTLEAAVEALAALPFVDVLYIRCDWRDVQGRPGRLDLQPVWDLTFDAARRRGLRVGFRVQLSNPEIQPARLAVPDFVKEKVPFVPIGTTARRAGRQFVEPRYDHPEFQRAFRELNDLLAARFDGDPLVEFMDLMMYGFWGEGHTSDCPSPSRSRPRRAHLPRHDRAADGGLAARAARRQHPARHQPRRQPRGAGRARCAAAAGCARTA